MKSYTETTDKQLSALRKAARERKKYADQRYAAVMAQTKAEQGLSVADICRQARKRGLVVVKIERGVKFVKPDKI